MERVTWIWALVVAAAIRGTGGGAEAPPPDRGGPSAPTPDEETVADTVPLYGVWSRSVRNDRDYDNPYDFREIELRATYRSPDGRTVEFFGFHDGDGEGGVEGNVWRLRFMPDETGEWTYRYRWTDGTPGDSGSFQVRDTGIPGPLRVDGESPRYFETARGDPFHFRGYDLHVMAPYLDSRSLEDELDEVRRLVRERVAGHGYNFTMLDGLIGRRTGDANTWEESWWVGPNQRLRFDPGSWRAFEEVLRTAAEEEVYAATFAGMVYQGEQYAFEEFRVFLRYWTARLAPFYNFFGFSPTWEWPDIWSPEQVNEIMSYVDEVDPFGTLLSVHDCSDPRFEGWLDFSMRQAQSRTVRAGNSRNAGQSQGACAASGGVGEPFLERPILGSEDVWEAGSGANGLPRNPREVRRGAWGIVMGGIMPLYSDWHPAPPPRGGEGRAEPEIRRMFDFVYAETRYRDHRRMNEVAGRSSGRVASGIPGEEYLVYSQGGGDVELDLTATEPTTSFEVLWFDPATGERRSEGTVAGGRMVTLQPAFDPDAVALLRRPAR